MGFWDSAGVGAVPEWPHDCEGGISLEGPSPSSALKPAAGVPRA